MHTVISKALGMGTLVLAGVAMLVISSAPVGAAPNPNPGVFPPTVNPYGTSYDEWADRWWQWVDAIPMSSNPMIDPTGANCAVGQSGPVWFIAGSPGGSYERSCTVPAGKGVFFPVSNFQEDQREAVPDYAFFGSRRCPRALGAELCTAGYDALSPDPTDPAAMLAFIEILLDAFVDPNVKFATVDGVAITDLASYRASSGPGGYEINLPATEDPFDNYHTIFGYAFPGPDTYLGVQVGYYLMLSPLSAGEHVVRFGEEPDWAITYELTVE